MEGLYQFSSQIVLCVLCFSTLVNASYSTYGNTIKLRQKYLDRAGKKSWIDLNPQNILPNGTLSQFHVFIHDVPKTVPMVARLQIWRPEGSLKYRLVWEKRAEFQADGYRREIFNIDDSTARVAQGDRIGWTYEADTGPISYDNFPASSRSIFFSYKELPMIDGVYEFSTIPFPSVFSVAVVILDSSSGDVNATIVTPKYEPPPPRTTTTAKPTTTTVTSTSEILTTTKKPAKPLPNWFPYAIIGVALFIVVIIIAFVLLYLRDRNYRRTRYDVYDVKFRKGKGHQHSHHHEYPSAEIMFPTSVGLSGYKHDLNYYLDVSNYDMNDYENLRVQLGPDGGRQVHDNAGFMAEAIIHHGDEEEAAAPNNNNNTPVPNGHVQHTHSEDIENIQHI